LESSQLLIFFFYEKFPAAGIFATFSAPAYTNPFLENSLKTPDSQQGKLHA